MSSSIAFPFLVASDDAIRIGEWMIGEPGQPLCSAQDVLENWDYAQDLEVCVTVFFEWEKLEAALQLPSTSLTLGLRLIAGTGTGSLPRRQDRLQTILVSSGSRECVLSGVINGSGLSGRLRLILQIVLDDPCHAGTSLSPKLKGARLWQAHRDILLEDGGCSRFPVEAVGFSQVFRGKPHEHAPWYLHWRPDSLQSDFCGSVRLYVNSERAEFLSRFVKGDGPTLQAIMGDVMSQMVESVLDVVDADEILTDCEEGSVGRQIRKWLVAGFPGQEVPAIAAIRSRTPGAFRAALLAAADMGAGE